ncbi:MAG: hypothetical protein WBD45_09835, partial [Terriglobales bacterium]
AAAVTEVIFGGSEQADQAGPVRLSRGEAGGEKELASLVESLMGRYDASFSESAGNLAAQEEPPNGSDCEIAERGELGVTSPGEPNCDDGNRKIQKSQDFPAQS